MEINRIFTEVISAVFIHGKWYAWPVLAGLVLPLVEEKHLPTRVTVAEVTD